MIRNEFLSIRTTPLERQLAAGVAARLGLTESALVRTLIGEKAHALGLLPATQGDTGIHVSAPNEREPK